MVSGRKLKIEVGSEKLLKLLGKHTFKGAHGGRAGMKSYFFADMHIARALCQPGYRALCLREVQKSIKESSKRLLEERIQHYGVGEHFEVLDQEIRSPGGGVFVFHGLQNHTAESLKSFEGFDVADIEEGQTIRQRSLDLLVPTIIRKKGAQIWARWNPRHDDDPIDNLFRGSSPPPNSVCVEIDWRDNPWLSKEVRAQIDADYAADPDKAQHIWGGGYETVGEASYYGRWIAQADRDGRIGSFPYNPQYPVDTAWDIGVDDYTAVWLLQNDGVKAWAIGYFETNGEGPETIIPAALPAKYKYGVHYFPHDIAVREWGAGARSRIETVRSLGLQNIRIGVQNDPEDRVAAVRRLLPILAFDNASAVGVKRLRNYRRRFHEPTGTYGGPFKDGNDHGSDALGEFAINCPITPRATPPISLEPPDLNAWKSYGSDDDESWKVA